MIGLKLMNYKFNHFVDEEKERIIEMIMFDVLAKSPTLEYLVHLCGWVITNLSFKLSLLNCDWGVIDFDK